MSTDTPRTDDYSQRMIDSCVPKATGWTHWYRFASGLERELNAARARIAELEAECEQLKNQRNRAGMDERKEVKS